MGYVAGDYGIKIELSSGGYDLSNATTLQIHWTDPTGGAGVWPATRNGTTKAFYLTQLNDVAKAGTWLLRLVFTASGRTLHGAQVEMQVEEL